VKIKNLVNAVCLENFLRSSRAVKVLGAVTLVATAGSVSAATGWSNAAGNITEFGTALVTSITVLCAAGGVGAIGYAGKLLMKKSGDQGEQVEWSKIGYATLAGAFLLSVSFIASTTVETLGGTSADIGTTVNIAK
jgi:hypothetical protein